MDKHASREKHCSMRYDEIGKGMRARTNDSSKVRCDIHCDT